MAKGETDIVHAIMLALSQQGVVVFKNVRGSFKPLYGDQNRVISAGLLCDGSSDLIGYTKVTVTPDMIGDTLAVFTAIEVKTPTGRPTEAQLNFVARVKERGGFAGISRSVEDALKIVAEKRK